MRKKISLGATIALMAVIATITFSVTMVFSRNQFDTMMKDIKLRESLYTKLSEVDAKIRSRYLGEIDSANLMDGISDGYMSGIGDRYAQYFTAEEYKKEQDALLGNVVGIGVEVSKSEAGYILVHRVYSGTPASDAGLQAGDLITIVNGEPVTVDNVGTKIDALRGEPGTTLVLNVRRGVEDLPVELVRKQFEIPTVHFRMVDQNAYIQITQFTSATVGQFKTALDHAIRSGATGIIFDVRDNGGGVVDSATEILDLLLPQGVIATATYADKTTKVLAESDEKEVNLPMVVLTNQNTASAAELFTQALRDYNKAKSVGMTTYGKGVMQEVHQLSDGSAVRFTVATYATAKSENFNGIGIKPDFEKELEKTENTTAIPFESVNEQNDTQFKKAIEVVNTLKK